MPAGRLLGFLSVVLQVLLGTIFQVQATECHNDFRRAAMQGVIDLSSNRWSGRNPEPLLQSLRMVRPGILNRFAFFYGGITAADFEQTALLAKFIHSIDPCILLEATLPEVVSRDYEFDFKHNGREEKVRASQIGGLTMSRDLLWIDMSVSAASDYYSALAKKFIDIGFSVIHFENPSGVIDRSREHLKAKAAYVKLADDLHVYAEKRGRPLYLSGDIGLANVIRLDAVYEPARFYHLDTSMRPYRNKIDRPGVGIGYSYSLSPIRVQKIQEEVPPGTLVFCYVDNWDERQDDLRRLMELDQQNRRFLIASSVMIARELGEVFVPALNHCVGCVPPEVVGDECELLPDGRTEYDAAECGDIPVITDAFRQVNKN